MTCALYSLGSDVRFKRIRSGGFTLIELIAAIVLMSILAVGGSSVIANIFSTGQILNRNAAISSEARYAMERLSREIREINYTGGAYVASNMAPTNFIFTRSDGVIVTIDKTGANLTLAYSTLAGVTATLSNKVDTTVGSVGFALTYLDVNGVAVTTSTLSTLRFVKIELTVKDDTGVNATGFTTTLRTRVAVRNA